MGHHYQDISNNFYTKVLYLKALDSLNNRKNYDFKKICLELNELLLNALKNLKIKLIILECTNLSPYKRFFRNIFSGEIIDLLVLIEKKIPGIIQKEFL